MADWYYTSGGQRQGPVPESQLRQMVAAGQVGPNELVWTQGMAQWSPASTALQQPGQVPVPSGPGAPPSAYPSGPSMIPGAMPSDIGSKKLAAGLCGILIGTLGVHKFVLGLTTPGLVMLLVTVLTCGIGGMVMWPIGVIEGILYLTKSDEEFYQRYIVEQQGWF
jgi:TM2 domain-containing membrane protein YozV